MSIYCTYLTIYHGNKLPPFYIGSSRVDRIKNGYRGSVSSKKYKEIWKNELSNNPHLFKTYILTYHDSQKMSILKELFFHEKLNVVKSEMYINRSKARKNGFFGMDVSGSNNPMFGTDRSVNHPRGMFGKKHSENTKSEWSKKRKGKMTGDKNPMFGKTWTKEQREKILAKRVGKKRGPYKKKLCSNNS